MKGKIVKAAAVIATCAWLYSAAATAGEASAPPSEVVNGTPTVSLPDIDWPTTISGLNAFNDFGNKPVLPAFSLDTESMEGLQEAVSLHRHHKGIGEGEGGREGRRCERDDCFHPGVMPVSLPGTLAMFASGLVLVVLVTRRRGLGPALVGGHV